ncbi:MAG: cobalamin-dependent methionine synthase I [Crocinitomicaceae bacterium]|jgi:cobalamin-dependent methionine synthase I
MILNSYKMLLAIALLGLPANARTWTSADGLKTFEGKYSSFNEETKEVTVVRKYKKLKFAMDMLSETDQEWVNTNAKEEAAKKAEASKPSVEDQLAAQTVGSKLNEDTLVRLEGKRFKKAKIEKVPEYYLLYFTASW